MLFRSGSWLSPNQYVPLIVLNSPVGDRYDKVMGQIDIYPTLLQLFGLEDYAWKGLGHSILDPNKPAFAVNSLGQIEGSAENLTDEETAHARRIYDISDLIIATDYFKDSDFADKR